MAGPRDDELLLTNVEVMGATGAGPGEPAAVFDLLIAGSRIAEIGRIEPRPGVAIMDGTGWRLAPGLIDLQVNGGWGHDLTADPAALWTVGAHLPFLGVTAWLPTLVSADRATRCHALEVLAAGPPNGWFGAVPLGWHFEGPYLNPNRRGAHPADSLEPIPGPLASPPIGSAGGLAAAHDPSAQPAAHDPVVKPAAHDPAANPPAHDPSPQTAAHDPANPPAHDPGAEPLPRLMTLAPELPGGVNAVANLTQAGVAVSIGHSEATATEVAQAVAAGAIMGTHLFNAMGGLHHRRPGTAAGLLDSSALLGLIVDHHHIAPELIRLVWSAAADRIVVVSDAMAGLGLPDGRAGLSGVEVTSAHGAARLDDGTLAGSVTSLLDGVRNLSAVTGTSLDQVIATATRNPADAMGDSTRGRLEVGCRADMVAFDPDDRVVAVFIGGRRLDPPDPTAGGS